MSKPRRKLLVAGMMLGGLLSLSPLLGALGTVVGMMRSFQKLGSEGVASPGEVANAIGFSLGFAIAGLILFFCGIGILIPSIMMFRRSAGSIPPPIPETKST